ncbi:hypothetical protein ANO11243_091970 [Dothideomycetidae sp. 11243]|nr:hypothetical protein ANO11243_091970 [fungal sp. No.11243]
MVDKDEEAGASSGRHRTCFGLVVRFPVLVSYLPTHSWAWFLMSMTTLGLSTLLYAQISLHNFHGLYTIGLVVYLIGAVQFFILVLAKTAHFLVFKGSLRKSFDSPDECLFSATFLISCFGMITGALDFAQPKPGSRLSLCLLSLFWIYVPCALLASVGIYSRIFAKCHLELNFYTPAWVLPTLPIVLTGVMAGSFGDRLHPEQLYPVIVAGLLFSSMGFLISLHLASVYFIRLFSNDFPEPDKRPGMMIAVGPPTFAPLAYLKLVKELPAGYGFFAAHPTAIEVFQILSLSISIGIFGMGIFFFLLALRGILPGAHKMSFDLTWYAFVFPNVGFFSAMGLIGAALPSQGVVWTATSGIILLTAVWLFVSASHIIANVKKSK